jgi:hypothetical protein
VAKEANKQADENKLPAHRIALKSLNLIYLTLNLFEIAWSSGFTSS